MFVANAHSSESTLVQADKLNACASNAGLNGAAALAALEGEVIASLRRGGALLVEQVRDRRELWNGSKYRTSASRDERMGSCGWWCVE